MVAAKGHQHLVAQGDWEASVSQMRRVAWVNPADHPKVLANLARRRRALANPEGLLEVWARAAQQSHWRVGLGGQVTWINLV